MGSWLDTDMDDYVLFLSEWRTRKDIMEKFNLSNVSSWHCVKFLSKLSEIQCVKNMGRTKRSTMYKSRAFALEEAISCKKEKKEIQDENIFSSTNNK